MIKMQKKWQKSAYIKLQVWNAGFFRIIKVHPHTVVLKKEKVPNTVPIHIVTAAP